MCSMDDFDERFRSTKRILDGTSASVFVLMVAIIVGAVWLGAQIVREGPEGAGAELGRAVKAYADVAP